MSNQASSQKVEKALGELKHLIANGVEYPDAEWKAASKARLTTRETDELRAFYDEA